LRATTTMLTALANGATALLPVNGITEALAMRKRHPDFLLAGERFGLRIRADQADGVEFDLGNSPREFTGERVAGRTIIITTTNGTRALRACGPAKAVLVGGLVNRAALRRWIERERPPRLLLVCSGTYEEAAYEDVLGAGALAGSIAPLYDGPGSVQSDSVAMARQIFAAAQADLPGAVCHSRNGRRLLGHAELAADVPLCLALDTIDLVGRLEGDGMIRRLAGNA